MISKVFSEEEFVDALETGRGPQWFEDQELALSPDVTNRRKGSHNDQIDLDHLCRAFLLRRLYSLFGRKPVPKKLRANVTYAILELSVIKGLLIEQAPTDKVRSFISTERLAKYWSKIFGGEPLPLPDKSELS